MSRIQLQVAMLFRIDQYKLQSRTFDIFLTILATAGLGLGLCSSIEYSHGFATVHNV
jgi:hypothetical protein